MRQRLRCLGIFAAAGLAAGGLAAWERRAGPRWLRQSLLGQLHR
ncbi:hypothetical protein ACWDAO_33275 [Streptomyces sp. NPDC001212]|nr:hypothetical protein [Streptomyces sp. CoT10]